MAPIFSRRPRNTQMNMLKKTLGAAVVALTMALPGASQAATIYDAGWQASDFKLNASWCSGCDNTQHIYAKLTLGADYNLTSATWVSFPGYVSAITFEVWNEAHTALIYTQGFLQGDVVNTAISDIAVERKISLPSVLLNSGTYLFSFFGPANVFYGFNTGSDQYYSVGISNLRGMTTKAAFRLEGVSAVPLPATLPLMAAAFAGFGLLRRKRRA